MHPFWKGIDITKKWFPPVKLNILLPIPFWFRISLSQDAAKKRGHSKQMYLRYEADFPGEKMAVENQAPRQVQEGRPTFCEAHKWYSRSTS